EPNDTCAQAFAVQGQNPNVFANPRFDSVDDSYDYFKFDALDTSSYPEHILIGLDAIPMGHDYDVYLYDSLAGCMAETPIGSSANNGNAPEMIDWTENFGTNDSGTYYVKVVRFIGHSCTDNYRLTINGLN